VPGCTSQDDHFPAAGFGLSATTARLTGATPLLLGDPLHSIYQLNVHEIDSAVACFCLQPWSRKMDLVRRFLNDDSGATAIEYGLIAAGISIAIIVAVNGLGTNLNAKFTSINSSLK
jgi:pilus assembly protein Flp/PilA